MSRQKFIATSATTIVLLFTLRLAFAAGSGGVNIMITHTEDAGPDVSYTGYSDNRPYRWALGNNVVFDGFIYNGTTYLESQVAAPDRLVLRRNDNAYSTGERCRVFAEESATRNMVSTFPGTPPPSGTTPGVCLMEAVLGGRILNEGTLDLFGNIDGDSPGGSKNTIERVDYITTAGLTLPNIPGYTQEQGILVNEKSHNNPFQIAVITALDGGGEPSNFGPLLCIRPGSSGNSGTSDVAECRPGSQNWVVYGPNVTYIENGVNIGQRSYRFRFLEDEPNSPHTGRVQDIGSSNEHLGAAFVSLEDLGVSPGATIYGYAWFPVDVVNCPAYPDNTCLADWTNTTIYPANTGDGNGGNGWDAGADIFGGLVGLFPSPIDFGDAPDDGMAYSYKTRSVNDGAAHILASDGPFLGPNAPDTEADGQPAPDALGDDDVPTGGPNDEGAVTAPFPRYYGTGTYYLAVPVNNGAQGATDAQLVGWIDWGDLNDPGWGEGTITGDGAFDVEDRSHPDLFSLTGPGCSNTVDNDWTTGNIPAGCVGTAILKWTAGLNGLPSLAGPAGTLNTYIRLRITSDQTSSFFTANSPTPGGVVLDGEVEDATIDVMTPITLGYFKADAGANPGDIEFVWQTVTEIGNLGFHLYARKSEGKGRGAVEAKSEGSWHAINDELIPSQVGDSVETRHYSYRAIGVAGNVFALGDVDVFGKETLHGPFQIDESQGLDRSQRATTDWKSIKAEHEGRHEARKAKREQREGYKLQNQLDREERKFRRQLQKENRTQEFISGN